MISTTLVQIDSKELQARYVDVLQAYKELEVVMKTLSAGDILINGLGIERKRIDDLLMTLRDGRLFTQLYKLKHSYQRQLLLIEGRGMRYHLDQEPFYGLYIRLAAGWQIPVKTPIRVS